MYHTPNITAAEPARFSAVPVPGIDPVDGWQLFTFDEEDGDRFWTPAYIARSEERDVELDVGRFGFTPSQERFAWLVRSGFPRRSTSLGGWDDTEIEHRLELERARRAT